MNAEEIKSLRKSLGLTQDQFASMIGVAPFTVRRWEAGKFNPSLLALKRLEKLKNEN